MPRIDSTNATGLSILFERQQAQQQAQKSTLAGFNGQVSPIESVTDVKQGAFAAMLDKQTPETEAADEQAIIAEGNKILEEIKANLKPGDMTFDKFESLGSYLTEQDKAFLDNLDIDEKLKASMGLSLALDRQSGALQGPLTASYLFGEGGLMERIGHNLDSAVLNGEEVDSMLDVMTNMREIAQNIMAALEKSYEVEDAAEDDGTINIYNADDMMAGSQDLASEWLKRMLEQMEEDEEFQQQLASQGGDRKWSTVKVIEESAKMLV